MEQKKQKRGASNFKNSQKVITHKKNSSVADSEELLKTSVFKNK